MSVPLDLRTDRSEIPSTNGVHTCRIEDSDDPQRFPNIAVLQFTNDPAPIRENVERIKAQRSVIDLPVSCCHGSATLGGRAGNPLLEGHGLPSAAFVESAYGIAGIELTPGLSYPVVRKQFGRRPNGGDNSMRAPGAGNTRDMAATAPTGRYMVRQPAAAVREPHNLRTRNQ